MAFVMIDAIDNDGNTVRLRIDDDDVASFHASGYTPKNPAKARRDMLARDDYRARMHNRFVGSVLLHGRI